MPKITPGKAATPVRKKQLIILGGLVVFIGAIVLIAAMMAHDSTPKRPVAKKGDISEKSFLRPSDQVAPSDAWRAQEGSRIDALTQQLNAMRQELEAQQLISKQALETANKAKERPSAASPRTPPPPPEPAVTDLEATPPRVVARPPVRPSAPTLAQAPNQLQPAMPAPRLISSIDLMEPQLANTKGTGQGTSGRGRNQNKPQTAENYLPSGTFIRAVNLSGLDAPTGGQNQNDPHPVVFRLVDHAMLPNKFRANVKECRVTGNGYGDISSERAFIRLDRLSCIDENGGAIDVDIKGYVAGEDGKAGMRGRLVEKTGQVLANALLVSVAGGIGQAFSADATTTSTSALGSVSTVSPGKEFQSGFGDGVKDSMDRLAQYYIALAEKMFPIVEVDAGRMVDIILTQGISIERQ
jgi:conjugal transfer pilus assembly protein TraB